MDDQDENKQGSEAGLAADNGSAGGPVGDAAPHDPDFERVMAVARKVMERRYNLLRELAR
jgi:hypothetical protein